MIPVEGGGEFEASRRFFDFSGVDNMPSEEDHRLAERPRVCTAFRTADGVRAFKLRGRWITQESELKLEGENKSSSP